MGNRKVLHVGELFHYHIIYLGLLFSYVFLKLGLFAHIMMWQLTLHLEVALEDDVDALHSVALTEGVLVAQQPRHV